MVEALDDLAPRASFDPPATVSDIGPARAPSGIAQHALVAAVVFWLALVLLLPLAALMTRAAQAGITVIIPALLSPGALHALGQSLLLASLAALLNIVAGVAGALVLVRQRFMGRRLLDALVDLPLAISPVMVGLALFLMFGREGVFAPVLQVLDFQVAFAFPGLLLCTLFVTLPFTMREVAMVLEELGTSEEDAAATLGASPWRTFWHVTLPNIRHALVLGVTLTVARALGEFGAVLIVGGAIAGRTQTATTFIYAAMEERQDGAAYGMAILLALISVGLLAILQRIKKRRIH